MAEEAKPSDASGGAGPAPAGGGSKVVTILLIVNCLLLAGVLAVLVLRPAGLARAKAPEGAEHAEAKEGESKEAEHPKEEKGEKADAKEHGGKPEKGEGAGASGTTVRLPDFIVHLRDPDSDRYARLSFEVEVKEEKGKDVISSRLPQIRDAFLAYLSDRTVDELRGSEAMAQMKEALTKRLHDIAPGAPVRALYVTDLVIQ